MPSNNIPETPPDDLSVSPVPQAPPSYTRRYIVPVTLVGLLFLAGAGIFIHFHQVHLGELPVPPAASVVLESTSTTEKTSPAGYPFL